MSDSAWNGIAKMWIICLCSLRITTLWGRSVDRWHSVKYFPANLTATAADDISVFFTKRLHLEFMIKREMNTLEQILAFLLELTLKKKLNFAEPCKFLHPIEVSVNITLPFTEFTFPSQSDDVHRLAWIQSSKSLINIPCGPLVYWDGNFIMEGYQVCQP